MKREMFLRPMRMTHRFGEAESHADPLGNNTFPYKGPLPGQSHRSPPLNISTHGEHRYNEPVSPVEKASGGRASLSGPAPDYASSVACTAPASTRKRKT